MNVESTRVPVITETAIAFLLFLSLLGLIKSVMVYFII